MDDLIGQQFGSYRIIRFLGHGGFARVYLGEHIHLQTQVAIKVLSTQLVPKDLERFLREARTVASLDHPHIVHVFDFGIENNLPFLVMNYAPNGTLQQRHAQDGRLPLATVVAYVQAIASALQYAHDRKFIHRDVKPENMLVGSKGEILLSDFGIAATTSTSTSQQTKTTAGTAIYMAPEQIMGKPGLTSDQYALGINVYTWLCGEQPFQGSFFEICAQHMHAPVPSLREKNPEIPVEVEQCVLKALAKDPTQRFARIQDFATALLEGAARTLPAATLQSLRRTITDPDVTYIKNAPGILPNAGSDDPTYIKTAPTVPAITGSNDPTYINTTPTVPFNAGQNTPTSVDTAPAAHSNSALTDVTVRDTGERMPLPPYFRADDKTEIAITSPVVPQPPGMVSRRKVLVGGIVGVGLVAVASGTTAIIIASKGGSNGAGLTSTPTIPAPTSSPTPASEPTATPTSPPVPPQVSANPATLAFTGTEGGSNPAGQSFTLRNTGGPGNWSASSDVAWLTLNPASGSLVGNDTITVNLGLTIAGLTANTYTGHISLSTGATTSTVTVTVTVQPAPSTVGNKIYTFQDSGIIYGLAWSPDSHRVVTAGDDLTVHAWDANTGGNVVSYTGHTAHLQAVAWSPNGSLIATGGYDNTVRVWNAANGQLIYTYTGHTDRVGGLAWSPDSTQIASGGTDKTVQVWNAMTGIRSVTYTGHTNFIQTVGWSPDGTRIASGGNDSLVKVWNASNGATLLTYTGHTSGVGALAWSPNSAYIASVGGTVQIWNASTGTPTIAPYAGHSGGADSVTWSPDGSLIASGGQDTTVQIWRSGTGNRLFTYTGHSGAVRSVKWSPDGTRIASGGWDWTAQVWSAK